MMLPKKRKPKWYEKDPSVIQRWVSIKMLPTSRKLARTWMRPYLTIKERKRRKQLESSLEAIATRCRDLEKTNFEASKLLFNLALYLLLAERDIQTVKIDAMTHRHAWKRNVSLRIILLTLHELDLGSVTGRRLKPALETAGLDDRDVRQALKVVRKARKTQERARKVLGLTRHSVIAHRDPGALLQYRRIRDIDSSSVLNVVAEFYDAAHDLYQILPKLIEQSSTIESLARQITDRSNR